MIDSIEHDACNEGKKTYWYSCLQSGGTAIVKSNSLFWSYRWAKTGDSSNDARLGALNAFYEIFGKGLSYNGKTVKDSEDFFERFDRALLSIKVDPLTGKAVDFTKQKDIKRPRGEVDSSFADRFCKMFYQSYRRLVR